MDIKKQSKNDLQKMMFYFRSWGALQKYFGLTPEDIKEIRAKGVKSPVDYMKSLPKDKLQRILNEAGSLKEVGNKFGVSESFLKTVVYKDFLGKDSELQLVNDGTFLSITSYFPGNITGGISLPVSGIKGLIEAYGSVTLFCHMMDIKESKFRKFLADNKIQTTGISSYVQGKHQNAKGRKAELYYKMIRGANILKDFNEDESHESPVDFEDKEFGMVNVKSASRSKYKAKTRRKDPHYWTFSLGGIEEADYFYFIFYDSAFEHVQLHFGVWIDKAYKISRKTVTFTVKDVVNNMKGGLLSEAFWKSKVESQENTDQ